MGLETSTYLSGLTPSWPLAGDLKAQGDDHIRLLKSTLQATFPTASKPFYFPQVETRSSTISLGALDATDQNNCIAVDTNNGADSTLTLPSTLVVADKGWECEVIKTTTDAFGIIVSPASGTISSRVGSTATIRVGVPFEPVKFRWSGTGWYCFKPGAIIGATYNLDVDVVPPGFLALDGSVYSNTTYAELFAVLATSTLKDKRGRTEIGSGTGSGLTARTLGTTYGAETAALATPNLPAYTPSGGVNVAGVTATINDLRPAGGATLTTAIAPGGNASGSFGSTATNITIGGTAIFTGNAQGGVSTPFGILQPSIAVKKIIRAC